MKYNGRSKIDAGLNQGIISFNISIHSESDNSLCEKQDLHGHKILN